uniref:Conserved hypothetical plastid protein n=1 Tax=Corallina chilensis TaxID=2582857 RepID=A0A4P8VWG8_9FLOR|nr:conserved hypothetical plastid protein [Corallina chilensis]QCS25617.1 conserved hypothetical plastid protein [Corallina chilensis]
MNFKNIKSLNYFENRKQITIFSNCSKLNQEQLIKKNIKRILIQGINNHYLKDKLFKNLSLYYFFNFKNKLKIGTINAVIKKLKYSGFFKKIQLSYTSINKKPCLIIEVFTNPIIKRIKVNNIDKLNILEKDLIYILKKQIGYPKNLKLLNEITKDLDTWYYARGYRWSKASYDMNSENNYVINIKEGQIDEIQLECINHSNKYYKSDLQQILLRELQLIRGQALNYHNLETGIKKLKTRQILLSCNYKIHYTKNHTLKIILKYRIPNQKSFYLFYQSMYLPYDLLYLMYLRWSSTLISFENYWPINSNLHRLFNLKYLTNIFDDNNVIPHNALIYKFWNVISCKNSSLYAFWQLKNNLRLKFYLNQFNNNFSHLLISFIKSEKKNKIFLIYTYPFQRYNTYNLNQKKLSIVQEKNPIKKNLLIFLSNRIDNIKGYLNNIISKNIELTLTNILSKCLFISQKIKLTKEIYEIYILCISENLQPYVYYTNNNILKKTQFLYKQLTCYSIYINSIINDNKDNIQPHIFWHLYLETKGTRFFDTQIFTLTDKLSHFISFHYKQIANYFIKNKQNIFGTTLLTLKINTILREAQFKYFSNNTLKINNYFRKIQNSKYTFDYNCYLLLSYDLELYIYKTHRFVLFIFMTSNNYINNFTNYKKNIYNVKAGIGILINLKIKLMPNIKLKYEFQNNYNSKFHASFYFR